MNLGQRRLLAVLLIALFAVLAAVRSTGAHRVGGDFLRYHRAGRVVATGDAAHLYDMDWIGGQRVYAKERAEDLAARGPKAADAFEEMEFKYDPSFAVLMAPLGALHPRTAWTIWAAWNGLLLGITFAAAFSLAGLRWPWTVIPLLVLAQATNSNLLLGQVNPTAIAAATVACWLLARSSDLRADLCAGAAA